MRNISKRVLTLILTICMASCLLCVGASARTSDYLDSYRGSITPIGGGDLVISVDVEARGKMTEIGASKIYLYESNSYGGYTRIETYTSDDYSFMLGSGAYFYKDLFTYKGIVGRQYYIKAFCYAGDSTGSDEKIYISSTVTCK